MDSATEEAAQLLAAGEEQPTLNASGRLWRRLALVVALVGTAGTLSVTAARALQPAGTTRFVTRFDEGVCSAEGTWNDGQGPVDFAVTDSTVSLAVAGQPRLHLAMGPSGVERFEVGHESVDMAAASEEARAGFSKVSRALGPRARGLSKYLAAQGWNSADRPCAYKLHMLLLSLAKQGDDRELMPEPHTGGYGHDDLCPAHKTADWKCRVRSGFLINFNFSDWMTPGDERLGEAHDKIFDNDVCEGPEDNQKCRGLCGKGCDCWESICGKEYLCNYNPVCCGHDVLCTTGATFDLIGCINVTMANFACSDEGLTVYGPDADSPAPKGGNRKGKGQGKR